MNFAPSFQRRSRVVASLAAAVLVAPLGAHAQAPAAGARPDSGPGAAPGRQVMSLREALQLAARQGPDVLASRAQASIVAASVARAWTAWQPDIVATGTFDHTSSPAEFRTSDFLIGVGQAYGLGAPNPAALNQPPTVIVGENSRYGTLQITQPLFSPQGLFGPGAAKAASEAAARGADEAREQALLGVARAYLSLQGVEGLVAAAREAEQVALQREKDARAQIEAGTAVEISLLRAQTETAQARVQLANLEGQRASLLPLLEALVGSPVEPRPAPVAGGSPDASELGTASPASSTPWENAYSVQSAIAAVRASERLVTGDRFLWLPTVAAAAKGNYNSNGGFSGKTTSLDLILTASIPLYDRGARYATLHEDEARLAQAQATLAANRARARAAWEGARANLASSQVALEQAELQAKLAARAQAQVSESAKAGVSTSLDLSDADNRRFLAASAAAQARAALDIRRAELAAAEGRLNRSIQAAQ